MYINALGAFFNHHKLIPLTSCEILAGKKVLVLRTPKIDSECCSMVLDKMGSKARTLYIALLVCVEGIYLLHTTCITSHKMCPHERLYLHHFLHV